MQIQSTTMVNSNNRSQDIIIDLQVGGACQG